MNADLRIVSLAPTQTEIVAALGAVENLAGVTENCDFPEAVKSIDRFGSWYSPDIRKVMEARPDLVLTFGAHQEEISSLLHDKGIRVYHSEPPTIADSLGTFRDIARIIGREEECARLLGSLEARLERIRASVAARPQNRRPSVFRIMNWDPLITPGPGAFQHDVIEFAGGRNVASQGPRPYFVCTPESIRAADPEIIFFCEPWIRNYLEEDPEWNKVSAVRHGRVIVFDCGLTCRCGPRIVDMAEGLHRAVILVDS
ncbi:MAG: helical backbone metal receptor [Desulfobacteraceae bacterium]|nr:helical backbone metal receptor [Desulfobacteraceae bacterium]